MTDHLLAELTLPDRYETLDRLLGEEVAHLLVEPSSRNVASLRAVASEVRTRDEGVLVPVSGQTGVGKTTFVMKASHWLPTLYTPACQYTEELSFDGLVGAVKSFAERLPADNNRAIPINIDHRENNPPSNEELATLKRFLRTNAGNAPAVVFWPETNRAIANELAERYVGIAGEASISLPLVCEGPPPDTWQDIAKHTLTLANHMDNLEELGVNPDDYMPQEFRTLGSFLRRLSMDFNSRIHQLLQDLERPISLIIACASSSPDPGVLSQLTSASRYGLLDSHALISATSQSELGRWWSDRRGLLTRAIVSLDARALCLAPTAAASCIRNFSDSMPLFETVGYRRYGRSKGVQDLARSDLGKVVSGEVLSRFESRGTPGQEAAAAFNLLAEQGFNLGGDKKLNWVMMSALSALLETNEVPFCEVTAERKLPFCRLIPDNAIYFDDRVQCIEYTWRKGDFLASGNRSTVAQYVLSKLQSYCRQLGWTTD